MMIRVRTLTGFNRISHVVAVVRKGYFRRPSPKTNTQYRLEVRYEKLQAIASRIRETKHMAAFWIAVKMISNQAVDAIDVFPHVPRAGCNIYPRRRSTLEHRLHLVQYCHQAFQGSRIKSTEYFDPTSAS